MLVIGSDQQGFRLKQQLLPFLDENKIEYKDIGSYDENSVDYPVIAKEAAKLVVSGECEFGILICGTGVGISIAANKVRGIRCALCSDSYQARLTRMHNDANMIAMGARVIGSGVAEDIISAFLSTKFEGGRHQRRIDMLENDG